MSASRFAKHGLEVDVEFIGTEEAARFLGVSPNALRIMVHRQQVRTHRLRRRLRFRVSELRQLISDS